MNYSFIIKTLFVLLVGLLVSGCQPPIQNMEATEFGVRFRKLPPILGGGVGKSVVSPGEMVFVWPWDQIYRFDTAVKYLSWGAVGKDTETTLDDYIHTRALDGNEVALGVTIQYQISDNPEQLVKLLQYVATSDKGIENIIQAVARADVRTYMNELRTSEFFNRDARYRAIDKAASEMNQKLSSLGIKIEKVILDEHRFERLLADGKTIDASYQERIDQTQRLDQDRQREDLRIKTVREKKGQELNETKAVMNRVTAEADGYKAQATFRGDSYLGAKENEAKGILAQGLAQVEGMKERINALAGAGGEAIVKLEMVRELQRENPKFVVMGGSAGAGNGLDVTRLDANELIEQAGIFEGLREKEHKSAIPESVPLADAEKQ